MMKRKYRALIAVFRSVSVASAISLSASACTANIAPQREVPEFATALNGASYPNDESLYIVGFVAGVARSDRCVTDPQEGAPLLTEGILDLSLRDRYDASAFFVDLGGEGARTEIVSHAIDLREDRVDGPRVIGTVPLERSASLALSRSADLDTLRGVGEVPLMDSELVQRLRREVCVVDRRDVTSECPVPRLRERARRIIARVTSNAVRTREGRSESLTLPTFSFAIHVCCGCLVTFPAEADLPSTDHPGPDCLGRTSETGSSPCSPGQDLPVDCRACATTQTEFCQPRGFQSVVRRVGGLAQRIDCPMDL